MTSLSDTYNRGPRGAPWTRRQLLVAVVLFVVGTGLLVLATVAATTDILVSTFSQIKNLTDSWAVAGVSGGLGIPLLTIAVFVVLPAGRWQQIAAGVGVALAVAAVVMFTIAFPHQWINDPTSYTAPTVGVYLLGGLVMLFAVFDAVASFRQRNNPGGTVTLSFGGGNNSDDDSGQTLREDP